MNNYTIDMFNNLKLYGMAAEFERQLANPSADDVPFEHRIKSMIDHEMTLRDNKRLQILLKKARLKIPKASIEDIDYRAARGLDKAKLMSLTSLDWLLAGNNVLLTGPTGTGKTWLSCALGNHACRMGKSVQFIRVAELLEDFVAAHATATFNQTIDRLKKIDLLILDDWGLEPFSGRAQNDMLELIESRLATKSLIITSQTPIELWHDLMPVKTVADALMDRLIHLSYSLKLSGESLRAKYGVASKKAK